MFRAKTVFVIGAGASAEVGLPVGAGLLIEITKLLDIRYQTGRMISGDHVISDALKILLDEGGDVQKYNEHLHAAWQLIASAQQALSIDNVIDALEDEKIELVGKLAITRAILEAEKSSNYFRPDKKYHDRLDLRSFDNTWYSYFTKLLTENIKKSEINNIFENVEIINFNYDRCLEHYLPFSIGNYYGIDHNQVRQLMNRLIVHRPYGVAGRLPWQDGDNPSVDFGSGNARQIADVAAQIRTFTERLEEGDVLKGMESAVSSAERIIFLGFAFHRQNVDLINSHCRLNVDILSTGYQISDSDKSVINSELLEAFSLDESGLSGHEYVEMPNMTCNDLFKNYWRTLTAGPDDEPFDMIRDLHTRDFGVPRLPKL